VLPNFIMDYAEYRKAQAERCFRYADRVTTDQQKEFWRRCAQDWHKFADRPTSQANVVGPRPPKAPAG
jgi:hypothetical protein